jgi:hypothetical protein
VNETLKTFLDILREIGLGGVVAIWALWRMEKKIDRGFFKLGRRMRRMGVATATLVKTMPGNEDLVDDDEGADE